MFFNPCGESLCNFRRDGRIDEGSSADSNGCCTGKYEFGCIFPVEDTPSADNGNVCLACDILVHIVNYTNRDWVNSRTAETTDFSRGLPVLRLPMLPVSTSGIGSPASLRIASILSFTRISPLLAACI